MEVHEEEGLRREEVGAQRAEPLVPTRWRET